MGFLLVSAFSVMTSIDLKASLNEFRSLALIIIFYLFCQNLKNEKKTYILLDILIISSTLAGAYGIFQYITKYDFLKHFADRSTGFFSHYLTFGEYMMVVLCLCIGQMVYKLSLRKRLFLSSCIILLLGGLLLSLSRGPWLAFIVAIGFMALLRSWKLFIILLIGAVLLFSIFFFFNLGKISMVLRSIFTLKGEDGSIDQARIQSNQERLAMWRSGFRILADNPAYLLTGIGMDTLKIVYPKYKEPEAKEPKFWHLHSNFEQIFVARGLLGLIAFLWIFGTFFNHSLKEFRKSLDNRKKGIMLGILAGAAGFLVSGFTEYSWGDTEVVMLFYCLMGISIALSRKGKTQTSN